jgi:outer membrane receptor protein involved in Fe transport
LRLRYFSDAPLVEDGSVESEGSFIANLALGWAWQNWRTQLTVINLFDADDHDIDYYYASRLPGELSEGLEDTHYHPFEPRQLRLSLSRSF